MRNVASGVSELCSVVAIDNGFLVLHADAVKAGIQEGLRDSGSTVLRLGLKTVKDEVLAEHEEAMAGTRKPEGTPYHALVRRARFCADLSAIQEAVASALVAQRRIASLEREGKLLPGSGPLLQPLGGF